MGCDAGQRRRCRCHGGRANRPGTHALYLALEPVTAVREYQQASTLLPPGTLVSYTVELSKVVDFRAGYKLGAWPELWEEFACDWRELWFNQGIEPPSWVLADAAIAASAMGILFASTVEPGGTNLVIYTQRLGPLDRIEVHDPAGRCRRIKIRGADFQGPATRRPLNCSETRLS